MNITDIINKSGMSREEICQKSGVSRSMLSFMENGKRQIGPDRAPILAEVLGVTVNDLRPDLAKIFSGGSAQTNGAAQ